MADHKSHGETLEKKTASVSAVALKEEKHEGFLSRIWNGIFRLHGDDFEKRLQYLFNEEAAIVYRMKKRSQDWRHMRRHIITFSIILEVIAVSYAVMATRRNLNWKTRTLGILPMFVLPAFSCAAYSAVMNFYQICDRKDQRNLERLRAERQAKLDELKARTNYYSTQQLIQRYDTDPAAKAAATSVLASKLGVDSGLKVLVGDEFELNSAAGKSSNVGDKQPRGLRHRHKRSSSPGSIPMDFTVEESTHYGVTEDCASNHNKPFVENYQNLGSITNIGGWLARIATLLVGEDPTQCYAIICSNCHMHNGLARKEDFPYITFYCRHCQALNRPKQLREHTGSIFSSEPISKAGNSGEEANNASCAVGGSMPTGKNPVTAGTEVKGPIDDDALDGHSPLKAILKPEGATDDSVPKSHNSPVNSTCHDPTEPRSEIESLDQGPVKARSEIENPAVDSVPTSQSPLKVKSKVKDPVGNILDDILSTSHSPTKVETDMEAQVVGSIPTGHSPIRARSEAEDPVNHSLHFRERNTVKTEPEIEVTSVDTVHSYVKVESEIQNPVDGSVPIAYNSAKPESNIEDSRSDTVPSVSSPAKPVPEL